MSDLAESVEQPQLAPRNIAKIIVVAVMVGILALMGWGLLQSTAPRPDVGSQPQTLTWNFLMVTVGMAKQPRPLTKCKVLLLC